MNFNKFINSDYLKENPLCGIGTYKDELNLATGACTRNIKKYEFTGNEHFYLAGQNGKTTILLIFYPSGIKNVGNIVSYSCVCSHYRIGSYYNPSENEGVQHTSVNLYFRIKQSSITDFITFLQQQYSAGTPVCIWYVLERPTDETITVPSGLSGTEEGYLNQSGTPTPTNPIYPTANTVEKWFDTNHYIMGTDTDTITTLPADLYADGTNATVGLVGNMSQSGTPTPQNPIQPSECGERTGNLSPPNSEWVSGYIDGTGAISPAVGTRYEKSSDFIEIEPNTTYTFSCNGGFPSTDTPWRGICTYTANKTYILRTAGNSSDAITITTESNAKYVRLSCRTYAKAIEPILNVGETAKPYEPYGQYKIPILSNSTTTPVYLGEVQSTRRIKKLVLTGGEDWSEYPNKSFTYQTYFSTGIRWAATLSICTHYSLVPNQGMLMDNTYTMSQDTLYIKNDSMLSLTDFKSHLAEQYSNGTPVTVWYILATGTTGIVNEPLRKIGTYADEVSGITIPTIAGTNAVDVLTTLKPSEVSVSYHGWHPVADVHERESGAWT